MMYGYDAGVLGGLLLHQPFLDAIGNPTGEYTIPMIVSCYSLAAAVTALVISFFTFRLGRRGTIILGNIAAVIGSVIQASSYSIAQLVVGRIVTGFAIGCISSAVPTYLSETGNNIDSRGPANAFNAALLISGVPLAYWIDYGFIKYNTQFSWRVPIIFQCVFAITSGTCMFFLPDTPRILYAKSRIDEGDAALTQLNDLPLEHEKGAAHQTRDHDCHRDRVGSGAEFALDAVPDDGRHRSHTDEDHPTTVYLLLVTNDTRVDGKFTVVSLLRNDLAVQPGRWYLPSSSILGFIQIFGSADTDLGY